MTVVQKWLLYMFGLGALYLVVSNGKGVLQAAQAGETLVGGTEAKIISGGSKG